MPDAKNCGNCLFYERSTNDDSAGRGSGYRCTSAVISQYLCCADHDLSYLEPGEYYEGPDPWVEFQPPKGFCCPEHQPGLPTDLVAPAMSPTIAFLPKAAHAVIDKES